MNSCIYKCRIKHTRVLPKTYKFDYDQIYYAIDLDELPSISNNMSFFSHNRLNIFSIKDKDYLDSSANTIKQKLNTWLKKSDYP